MGHGEEKMPAEIIDELRERLKNQAETITEQQDLLAARHAPQRLIHLKLIEVMREVTSVAKTGMNTQQNYPFRGIDGVMNEVGPAMRKVGVLAIPTVLQYKNRDTLTTGDKKTREVVMEVRYDFYAEDGSSVSAIVWGESLDFSDKGTAKALSVALRQALLQTLMLPTQEPTTDDNGHYHTRAGTPALSGWTAAYGKRVLTEGTLTEVIDFWPAIVESSSIEAQHQAGSGWLTWGELAAKRVADLINEERSPEALRELYGKLKAADMIGLWHVDAAGLRFMLGDLVVERGKQAKLNRDKAFNHCMELVTNAATLEELEDVLAHLQVDAEEGSITREQLADLLVVAGERSDKLTKELNVAAPREFLPPTGKAWNELCAALDAEKLTRSDLDLILSGDDGSDITPPCEFGADGVQRFIDAVKKAHRGDRSINAGDRAELFAGLRSYMHGAGIDWHEPID